MFCFFSITGSGNSIHSQNLDISYVRIWDLDKREFTSPLSIQVRGGVIQSIREPSGKKRDITFAIPGFCDAYATLGVNPWGGEASPDSLKISLQAFLSAGFTHVESVGDGNWITKVQDMIQKRQWKGPLLTRTAPPLLPDPGRDIPGGLYRVVRNDEDMRSYLSREKNSRIHIFHRNMGDYVPDLRFLFQLQAEYSKGRKWIVHTFADPLSSREALSSQWDTIFHPIPIDAPRFQMEKIRWSPLMAIYYYQTKRTEEEWMKERESALVKSPFFRISYEEVSKNGGEYLDTSEWKESKSDYNRYLEDFRARYYMKSRLIFSSGTGHPLVYPGLGGIQESLIWEDTFKSWELSKLIVTEESNVKQPTGLVNRFKAWFGLLPPSLPLQTPHSEPSKIPEYRKDLVQALSRDTCTFLEAGHGGEIKQGKEANFLIYDKNPLESSLGIHKPQSVYLRGFLSFGKK